MKHFFLIFIASILLAGCASVNVSSRGDHIIADAQNTCWYIFKCIPVASGNHKNPNTVSTRIFKSTVTLENNMKLLEYAMRQYNSPGVINVTSYTTDESILFFLLTRHACHTSAEIIQPSDIK